MKFRPVFSSDEFRCEASHYVLPKIAGRKVLYTYIRKNACSAFKQLMCRDHTKLAVQSDESGEILVSNLEDRKEQGKEFNIRIEEINRYFIDPGDIQIESFTNSYNPLLTMNLPSRRSIERYKEIMPFPIVHIYGKTADLPWQSQDGVEYR